MELLRAAEKRYTMQLSNVNGDPLPNDAVCQAFAAFSKHHRATAPRRAPVHPLILQSAAHRSSTNFLHRGERLQPLSNTSSIFHITHIAKTGGRSVKYELKQLVKPVGGAEQCHAPFVHASRISVVFFREPRTHVLSQYLHAAYAGRSSHRRAKGLPVVKGDDISGFAKLPHYSQWVRHFADDWTPSKGDFGGYNPMNMMARVMTCRDEHWNCDFLTACNIPCAHHVGPRKEDAFPPVDIAVAAVHAADVVGVLELLPEVICLLEYRLRGRMSSGCICSTNGRGNESRFNNPSVQRAHVMNSRRQRAARKVTIHEVPTETVQRLDSITRADSAVYRAAVLRVLCDIRALERATGLSILCHPKFERFQNQTSHIHGLWKANGSQFGTKRGGDE